ncbi:MAG TPA: site-2 protease family protein [Anaerolineales bacterium]|jgi:Zn-dependent protease|nr:site-2 protease family protein [Anaerolineales bacterium]
MTFAIVFFGWIFSLCLHEFSHALVAYYGGDYTVREKGYLTFNPLKYTHPVFSIVLPLLFLLMGGIGLPGGAVYIERWRIRNRYWLSAMSLAGPFSNLVFAMILGLILRFSPVTDSGIWPGVSFLLVLQISAVLFNLIPLPPFDGYNAIEPFLHPAIRMQVDRFRDMAIWIVLLAFWFVPFIGSFFWSTVFTFSTALGVDWSLAIDGLRRFRFWEL